jgi:hypothetical protein
MCSADHVITVSPVIGAAIQAHYGLAARPAVVLNAPVVGVAHLGPSLSVRDAAGVDPAVSLIVCSGGMKKVRGIDVAIRALEHLDAVHLAVVSFPSSHTVVVDELRAEALRIGVTERVHFVDPVDRTRWWDS